MGRVGTRSFCGAWILIAAIAQGGCSAESMGGKRPGPVPEAVDADGDGIADHFEGRSAGPIDTDGDGIFDYLDLDSDGDGLPDAVEGGNGNLDSAPRDSDGDGVEDFRDLDSDDNGIPDGIEPATDTDGDGVEDFRDADNDNDALPDHVEIGDPRNPTDSDGDGVADFLDLDSDNDNIWDLHEATVDTDRDGVPDRLDADSDGDGISDAIEAGDDDAATPPIDTDADSIADFRDPDSDNDGLADEREFALGTDPRNADSDGDGVSDLVEVAACAGDDTTCAGDALDAATSPRTRGDFVFFEPYRSPPLPDRDSLSFATELRMADVYFLMDTTSSMSSAITSLKTGLSTPRTGLIDRVRAVIPDVHFGVGDFRDYSASRLLGACYGSSGDFAYRNVQDMTVDAAAAQAAVNSLRAAGGCDGPESQVPALYAMATGRGLPGRSAVSGALGARPACSGGGFGYPCFRDGSVPIAVLITDAPFHNGPTGSMVYDDALVGGHAPTYVETRDALVDANIRVLGISVYGGSQTDLETLASDTGAVDGARRPLVTEWSRGEIGDVVVDQIETLANQTRMEITLVFEDDPSDAVDSGPAFVDHVEAKEDGDVAAGCAALPANDVDGDGNPDTFPDVTAGTRVCFDIIVKQNATVMPGPEPQLFRATLRVMGDGFTELDQRDIFFLVPPEVVLPAGPH